MTAAAPEAHAQRGTEVDGIYAALLDLRWKPNEIDVLTITDAGHLFREPDKPKALTEGAGFRAALAAHRAKANG